jgi:predicted transcriptional regulator
MATRKFDYDQAADMYKDGLSVEQIALLLGLTERAVRFALNHCDITLADKGRTAYERWAEKLIAAEAAERKEVER